MRRRAFISSLLAVLAAGCGDTPPTTGEGDAALVVDAVPVVDAAPVPVVDPLRHRDDLTPQERILVVIDGKERIVSREAARAAGYSEVDFSRGWVPRIFREAKDEEGKVLVNRYRRIFLGLANDETDGDGLPLRDKDERNFLEVFGIPPSMGVIRDRFVADAEKACLKTIDYALIGQMEGLTYRNDRKTRRHRKKIRGLKKSLAAAMKAAKVADYAGLRTVKPDLEDEIAYVERDALQARVLTEIEKRLDCDGHDHPRYRHKDGRLDHGLRLAVRRFQRKNKIYEHTNLRKKTMKLMAKPPVETNYLAFLRVLQERILAATGILEDGTTAVGGKAPTYEGADGKTHVVRNLLEEFTEAATLQLGLDTAEKTQAFFQRRAVEDMKWLRVGVKFPAKPEYYSDNMDLKLIIDRGDVWYDIPYKENGDKLRQRRRKMPKVALYLTYRDQKIRLVRWPTTIGGWRTEQASNGYVYLRYKGSDVGDRVIRKVIAGPTWVAPESTPLKSLAKRRYVNGKKQGIVNYAEMGPGYLSAYGLVAGYFVIPGRKGRADHDRGIRAHGSSDYMSIMSSQRFSHGCHRLMNHHAVRMYGFLLDHRPHVISGDQAMRHKRQFLYDGEVFEVRIPSRGFQYTLDPPLPVSVLEGDIKGDLKKPMEGYIKMPGEVYPNDLPEVGKKKKKKKTPAEGEAPK